MENKKSFQVILGEILGITIILTILGYFVYEWVKTHNEQKAVNDLGKTTGAQGGNTDIGVIVRTVPPAQAKQVAKDLKAFNPIPIGEMIYKAKGLTHYTNDVNNVYLAFAMITTKVQLALLSTYFEKAYHVKLLQYLGEFNDPQMMIEINKIFKTYKDY